MNVGIVGNGQDKFTLLGASAAVSEIRRVLLETRATVVVSGHSPMGGVDIWAEEVGRELGLALDLKVPEIHSWNGGYGYRARNLDIARASDSRPGTVVPCSPAGTHPQRSRTPYHCAKHQPSIMAYPETHLKSGGCWTGWKAVELGKETRWIVVRNGEAK